MSICHSSCRRLRCWSIHTARSLLLLSRLWQTHKITSLMHRACAPKLLEPHPTASLQPLLALRPCAPFLFSSLLPSQRAELQTAAVRLELCQIFTNKIFHFTRTNTFLAFPKKKPPENPICIFRCVFQIIDSQVPQLAGYRTAISI